jgi:hypothetical protein
VRRVPSSRTSLSIVMASAGQTASHSLQAMHALLAVLVAAQGMQAAESAG